MIVMKIFGGIGNQLFQYAFGLSQAKKLNTELKLDIDFLLYNPYNWTPYDFELKHFKGVNEKILTDIQTTLKKIDEDKIKIENITNDSILNGYWQGEYMFENIKDELRNKLVFKDDSISNVEHIANQIRDDENSVFIHARRGDYLNGDYFVNLSETNYYQKALEFILSKITNPTFYIFSNDIEWAKNYFKFINQNKTFLSNSTIKDLYLMSLCKNAITANSTFSWWSCWIGEKNNIVQPYNWIKGMNFEKWKLKGSTII